MVAAGGHAGRHGRPHVSKRARTVVWRRLRGATAPEGLSRGPATARRRPVACLTAKHRVPFWNRRHLVKPGITGWAQVSCGYASDAEGTVRKLSYDLWYLRHRSLAVDLGICAKTLRALVSGAGSR